MSICASSAERKKTRVKESASASASALASAPAPSAEAEREAATAEELSEMAIDEHLADKYACSCCCSTRVDH